MHPQPVIADLIHPNQLPLIDKEFDRFEMSGDLEANLREADTPTFYHDTFELEE